MNRILATPACTKIFASTVVLNLLSVIAITSRKPKQVSLRASTSSKAFTVYETTNLKAKEGLFKPSERICIQGMQSLSLAHLNFISQPVKALNNVLVWFILSSIFTLIEREKHHQIQKIIGTEVDKKSVIGFFQCLSLAAGQLYTIPLLAQPLSPAQHQVIDQALTISKRITVSEPKGCDG